MANRMREAFARIARGYETARQEPLTRHPMARFIREDAAEQVREVLPDEYQSLLVQGNPGVGNWAQVPWIAIFDPSITETATRGYYIVYLFSSDLTKVYLSLNQGTTIVHDEFGASYVEELGRRAALMRQRLPERGDSFLDIDINLASDGNLPRGYEAGHACGLAYDLENLPVDETLSADLLAMVPIYMNLRSRGGVSPLEGATAEPTDDRSDTITERRRYRTHRSIERNPNAGSRAKAIQGYTCQGCSFDFKVVYGEVGSQYTI